MAEKWNWTRSFVLNVLLSLFMQFIRAGDASDLSSIWPAKTSMRCPFCNWEKLYPPPTLLCPAILHWRLEHILTSFLSCHPNSFLLLPSNHLTITFHQADLSSAVLLSLSLIWLPFTYFQWSLQGCRKKKGKQSYILACINTLLSFFGSTLSYLAHLCLS